MERTIKINLDFARFEIAENYQDLRKAIGYFACYGTNTYDNLSIYHDGKVWTCTLCFLGHLIIGKWLSAEYGIVTADLIAFTPSQTPFGSYKNILTTV